MPRDRHAPPPLTPHPIAVSHSPAAAASSGAAPAVGSIDIATLAAGGADGAIGLGASLVLVRCAPPCEPLERAATSEVAPPPHAGLVSWDAWFVGEDAYMLRGARADGGVEWYALVLAPDDVARDADDSRDASGSRDALATDTTDDATRARARDEQEPTPAQRSARTALVGWRPLGRGNAARWSVAWRRP